MFHIFLVKALCANLKHPIKRKIRRKCHKDVLFWRGRIYQNAFEHICKSLMYTNYSGIVFHFIEMAKIIAEEIYVKFILWKCFWILAHKMPCTCFLFIFYKRKKTQKIVHSTVCTNTQFVCSMFQELGILCCLNSSF